MRHTATRQALCCALFVVALGMPAPAGAAGPDDLVGTWTWTWKDGEGKTHKHILDVESAAGKLTARERFDEEDSIKVDDLKLKGEEVSLSVKRGDRMAEYKGKLLGTKTINGLVNVVVNGQAEEFQWTAERALPRKD
jgi:hypothetical protein